MGLDSVELVLRFEEEFDLQIPDQAAAAMRTPGDVVEYVSARLAAQRSRTCETQRGFHRVRSLMMELWGIPRSSIRPREALERLVPAAERLSQWDQLSRALGLEQPALVRPPLLASLLTGGVLIIAGTALLVGTLVLQMNGWLAALVASTVLVGAGYTAAAMTRSFRTAFPAGTRTVGMLVQNVAASDPGRSSWTRELVWLKVREVVIEVLGRDDFTEDSDFVRDIGMA